MKNVRITAMERLVLEGAYSTISVPGVGNSTGGGLQAEKISVKGMMHFSNQPLIEADVVDCTGNCTMDSALKAGTMDVAGTMKLFGALATADLTVGGILQAQQVSVQHKTEVDGAIKADSIKTDQLSVDGSLKLLRSLECRQGEIDGVLKAGQMQVGSLSCDGVVEVQEDLHCGSMEIDGVLKAKKIEGESILCDGVLRVQTQISADRVTVEGIATAEEIVGDYILIDSRSQSPRHARQWFGKKAFTNEEKSRADLIEATTIRLYNVKAARVNGQDVVIGEGCEIGCVDCTGPLQIDPGAFVKSIVNNDKKI